MAEPQTADPVEAVLRMSPLTMAQKRAAWDAFEASPSADDLATKIKDLSLPTEVKRKLWDLKEQQAPMVADFQSTNEKDAAGRATLEPNSVATFARHVGAQINPVPIGQLMPFPKVAGGAGWDAPLQALKNIGAAHEAVAHQAKAAYDQGDYATAGRKAFDYLIPVLGPVLDQAADRMQRGEYVAAIGDAIGMALSLFGPKAIGQASAAGRTRTLTARPAVVNQDAAAAAAVQFGQSRGVPIDAGTATGNRFVQAAQTVADHSPLGSMVAERSKAATTRAMTRVGGELAEEASPVAATAEQAGQGVRDSALTLIKDLNAQATTAYDKLRAIEADPKHSRLIPSAPVNSPAYQRILGKLAAGAEDGRAPSKAELIALRQIETELDIQPFKPGKLIQDVPGHAESGTHYDYRSAGAPVFHEILQAAPGTADMTRGEVLGAIRKTLQTGDWTNASRGALTVARQRLKASGQLGGPLLPSNTPLLGTLDRVALPVELHGVKTALEPLYTRLRREAELVPLQGDKGRALVALDRLLNGPDVAPVSIVDAALGDLKSMARADIPELRTQGQGLAAAAVKELDKAVRNAAMRGGPAAIGALEEGRGATIGKYQTIEVLELLRQEPVQAYRQLTAPKDSAITLLRKVREIAPMEVEKVARGLLEDLLTQKADKAAADWRRVGTETRKILFAQPGQSQALDHFFVLQQKLKESDVFNASKSGVTASVAGQMTAAVLHPLYGIPIVALQGALSKLLHSPAGVRALTRGLSVSLKTPASVSGAMRQSLLGELLTAARAAGASLGQPLPALAGAGTSP